MTMANGQDVKVLSVSDVTVPLGESFHALIVIVGHALFSGEQPEACFGYEDMLYIHVMVDFE